MREYSKHKSYEDYQKDAIKRAKLNLRNVKKGSDRYLIIKDHIKRLEVQMSQQFKDKAAKYSDNSVEVSIENFDEYL